MTCLDVYDFCSMAKECPRIWIMSVVDSFFCGGCLNFQFGLSSLNFQFGPSSVVTGVRRYW